MKKEVAAHSSILALKKPMDRERSLMCYTVYGVTKESDVTYQPKNNRCLWFPGTQTLGHTLAHRRFAGKALRFNDGRGVKVAHSGRGRS